MIVCNIDVFGFVSDLEASADLLVNDDQDANEDTSCLPLSNNYYLVIFLNFSCAHPS